ncbi:RNA methyltransferase, partial [candidate division KSB1 bacterium]|nr:RNA methyltransferase [candidate division KSB1 bacterium]
YLLDDRKLAELVGFDFHRGVIAAGVRRQLPALQEHFDPPIGRFGLLFFPEVNDVENLGAMMRSAAAFGVHAVVIGSRCCDPFTRRAIRASMGAVFSLNLLSSDDPAADLHWLHERFEMRRIAAVLDFSARPLYRVKPPQRFVLLFGTEAQGLADSWIGLCDDRVTIPMAIDTDSLNVATACGIFLYHFMQADTNS